MALISRGSKRGIMQTPNIRLRNTSVCELLKRQTRNNVAPCSMESPHLTMISRKVNSNRITWRICQARVRATISGMISLAVNHRIVGDCHEISTKIFDVRLAKTYLKHWWNHVWVCTVYNWICWWPSLNGARASAGTVRAKFGYMNQVGTCMFGKGNILTEKKLLFCQHDNVIKWKHFRVTGPLCGEFASHRSIPLTQASGAELWCFLWSEPE